MYVRWKKYKRSKRHHLTSEVILTAVLVESHRIGGKPRQRFIAHLGSIAERGIPHYWHRHDFWQSVEKAIEHLSLDATTSTQIQESIERVVPRPSDESRQAASAALVELERHASP